MTRFGCYNTPLGILKIGAQDGYIHFLKFVDARDVQDSPTPVTDRAAGQILEYLAGLRTAFDLPLAPQGTPFQQKVWYAMLAIPYGEIRSYRDIAEAIGQPRAARAVGMACMRNPIWIVIPCHRVVGSNRTLTGYAGGLSRKQALLELEQRHI